MIKYLVYFVKKQNFGFHLVFFGRLTFKFKLFLMNKYLVSKNPQKNFL